MHAFGFTAGQKKKQLKIRTGPQGHRGPPGRGPSGRGGPWAAGRRAFGPPGRWAAGLLLAKPVYAGHFVLFCKEEIEPLDRVMALRVSSLSLTHL